MGICKAKACGRILEKLVLFMTAAMCVTIIIAEGCKPAPVVERPEIVAKPKITKGPFLLRVY